MIEVATSQLSIEEIARDTGLGKDTLRVWERRYGFPDPLRTANGERIYSPEQLTRLRLICRLIDQGCRPGSIVALSSADLNRLAEEQPKSKETSTDPAVRRLIELLQSGKTEQFKLSLTELLDQQGPKEFVYETTEPLLRLTGDAWAKGEIPIYLEHFVTQQLSAVIHIAQGQVTAVPTGLRVLLTTLPGEPHGMGMMMVELLLQLQGVETINIGVETPVDQLQQACHAFQPHALALSFSAVQKRPQTMTILNELDQKIPSSVVILAGGQGIIKLRSVPDRITVIKQMNRLDAAMKPLLRQLKAREQ